MESRRAELYHHGIKGQQWGVRRGPPYPIEDKILKRGTQLNSVSVNSNSENYRNNGKWLYTYNANDRHDSSVYEGPFASSLSNEYAALHRGRSYVYKHSYEVVKDLKMPTRKERVDEFIRLCAKRKRMVISDLSKVQKEMVYTDMGSEEAQNLDFKRLKRPKNVSREDYERAYEVLGYAMRDAYLYRTTRAYSKIMAAKYDAMVDDNDQGTYRNVHDPVIIFRANEALRTIGDVRVLDAKEVLDNIKTVAEEESLK